MFTLKSLADRVFHTITIKLAVCLSCINKRKGNSLKYWSSFINAVNCALHVPSPGTKFAVEGPRILFNAFVDIALYLTLLFSAS